MNPPASEPTLHASATRTENPSSGPTKPAKRILVTGAGGYIGRHVVAALLDRGASVIAVDRSADERPGRIDPRATIVAADIFSDDLDMDALHSPDVCIHLAWEAGFVHNSPTHMLRLSDHYRFLRNLVQAGVSQVAVLGSMHEVGYHEGPIVEDTPTNPLSLYGVAKNSLRQALTIDLTDQPTVLQWLRCYYIYGDDENNSSIFTRVVQAAKNGEGSLPFTTGKRKFDFLHVEELARQIALTALQTEITGVINCCSGTPRELGEMVETFIKDRDLDLKLIHGAYPDRPYDSPAIWGDPTKIRRILTASGEDLQSF